MKREMLPNRRDMPLKKRTRKIFKAVTVMIVLLWIVWSNVTVEVTHYRVFNNRVPVAFEQYKIAVISDLHNAQFGANNSYLLSVIEKERPDIIAVTGDLVDSERTDMEVADCLVNKLTEIAPCYYVTGNHEAWIGKQYQELEEKLSDAGVVILHDRVVNLTKGDETIQIAGLDDPEFISGEAVREYTPAAKLDKMNLTEEYCILLAHRPENFDAYVSANADLVFSGHAHGGQFRLPFVGGVVAPGQGFFPKYDSGKYVENNTTMIVSRGIGNSVIPIRINNRPEVVIVELRSGSE